jgi:altronate dehydratase small subunit
MVTKRGLMLNPLDNVGNMLEEALMGETVQLKTANEPFTVEATERIPFGFKIAARDIASGEPIVKYGETIGLANSNIRRGALVHVHNLSGVRGRGDLEK